MARPGTAYLVNAGPTPMPAQPLRAARKQEISRVLAGLAAGMPAWAPLLSLPVRYARLHPDGGAISASSRDWPQHVLLADERSPATPSCASSSCTSWPTSGCT